jgi:hypothetical protein
MLLTEAALKNFASARCCFYLDMQEQTCWFAEEFVELKLRHAVAAVYIFFCSPYYQVGASTLMKNSILRLQLSSFYYLINC